MEIKKCQPHILIHRRVIENLAVSGIFRRLRKRFIFIVITLFLLLRLCIITVYLCMTTLTEVFPCFFLSCKANAMVKSAKTGHGPHSS